MGNLKLYLVQHAKSLSQEVDPDRPLSTEGWKEIKKLSAFLLEYINVTIKKIFHSGQGRAQDTAETLDEILSPMGGVTRIEGINPNDPVEMIVQKISGLKDNIMIVGHQPHLKKLFNILLRLPPDAEIIRFSNSEVICLEKKEESWKLLWKIAPEDILTD